MGPPMRWDRAVMAAVMTALTTNPPRSTFLMTFRSIASRYLSEYGTMLADRNAHCPIHAPELLPLPVDATHHHSPLASSEIVPLVRCGPDEAPLPPASVTLPLKLTVAVESDSWVMVNTNCEVSAV